MAKRRRIALTREERDSICGDDAFKFLVNERCLPTILEQAVARYAHACLQPQELRAGLRAARISYKQLNRKAAEAKTLRGFLKRLQGNADLVLANQMPYPDILYWCKCLDEIASFLPKVVPWRPGPGEPALVLVMHVQRVTGKKHLPKILSILGKARAVVGLPQGRDPDALISKQIARANHSEAERLLREWQLLV
jgi:hypothetical protein